MNKLEIAVALIKNSDQRTRWLGKLDHANKRIDFVTAQRLEKESWRESVMREVAWELDLDRKRDFVVSKMAQLNVQMNAVLPGQAEESNIACAFYNVELYRKVAVASVDQKEDCVWLTSTEICRGVTDNGAKLNPLFLMLNAEANVIQHWESDFPSC